MSPITTIILDSQFSVSHSNDETLISSPLLLYARRPLQSRCQKNQRLGFVGLLCVGLLADSSNFPYWTNYFPVFYFPSQITIADFSKMAQSIFFLICIWTPCHNKQLSWAMGENQMRIFSKNSPKIEIFHITPIYLAWYFTPTLSLYAPSVVRAQTSISQLPIESNLPVSIWLQ